MFNRIARIAGSTPTSRPIATISPRPSSQLAASTAGIEITPPLTVVIAGPSAAASPSPSTPPINTSRSEEHTSELQSLMRISYAVFCLKKQKNHHTNTRTQHHTNEHPHHITLIPH